MVWHAASWPDGRYNRHKISLFLLAHKAVWDLFQRGFGLHVQGQVEWRHNWKWWNYHDVESLLFIILPVVTSSACLHWEIDFHGLSHHVGAFPHGDEWDEHICTWGTLEHVCRQPLISSVAQLGSRTLLRRRYLSGWMDRKRLGRARTTWWIWFPRLKQCGRLPGVRRWHRYLSSFLCFVSATRIGFKEDMTLSSCSLSDSITFDSLHDQKPSSWLLIFDAT